MLSPGLEPPRGWYLAAWVVIQLTVPTTRTIRRPSGKAVSCNLIFGRFDSDSDLLLGWRNGRRAALRSLWPKGREGSSPSLSICDTEVLELAYRSVSKADAFGIEGSNPSLGMVGKLLSGPAQ